MRRVVLIALIAALILFGIGVDAMHCVVMGLAVFAAGVVIRMLGRVPQGADAPDPLLIPYSTTLLRSYAFSDPRSKDPVGEFAGRRAAQVCEQALINFPGDPVLTEIVGEWGDSWRLLPQRTLNRLLDRIDQLQADAKRQRAADLAQYSSYRQAPDSGRNDR